MHSYSTPRFQISFLKKFPCIFNFTEIFQKNKKRLKNLDFKIKICKIFENCKFQDKKYTLLCATFFVFVQAVFIFVFISSIMLSLWAISYDPSRKKSVIPQEFSFMSSFLSGLFVFLFHEVLALSVHNFFNASFCFCNFCDHSSPSRFGAINHIITLKDFF